jgi:hypothetical protein
MNTNSTDQPNDLADELSLLNIFKFIQESWKRLVLAGVAGAALGFCSWYFLGSYKAEIILSNNNNSYALDLVTWRTLQKSLPSLAGQIITQDNLAPERKDIYGALSDPQWWVKNIAPSYAISKADAKDLAMISKDLDSAATRILSFTINAGGLTKERALDNVRFAS